MPVVLVAMAGRAAGIDEAQVVVAARDVHLVDMAILALARVVVARMAIHAAGVTQDVGDGFKKVVRRRLCAVRRLRRRIEISIQR